MIRAFVAIRPPADVIDRLVGLQAGAPGRVSPPENLHLTLAFLGEIPSLRLRDADAALAALKAERFTLQLDGVGLFGGRKPRILYAGVRTEPALTALHAKVAQAAREAGIALESRRYTPHVTLARLGGRAEESRKAERYVADRSAFQSAAFDVSDFGLYRSDLRPGGPVYAQLSVYLLY